MPAALRLRAVRLLRDCLRGALPGGGGDDGAEDGLGEEQAWARARIVERSAHEVSVDETGYHAAVMRCALNCRNRREHADVSVARRPDEELVRGTLLERVRTTEDERRVMFQQMLQDKFESIDTRGYTSSLRCRRCHSVDVTWEQKQTRSADEAATVYCACTTCHHRWTMR